MNDTLYFTIIVGLIILIIRLLYVAFLPNRKILKSRINLPYEKINHISISTVNTYLDNLEKSIPIYIVKAVGAELLDREFNNGKDEERLEKAKKFFRIVHQNLVFYTVHVGCCFVSGCRNPLFVSVFTVSHYYTCSLTD